MEEVSKHNIKDGCWVIINGKVKRVVLATDKMHVPKRLFAYKVKATRYKLRFWGIFRVFSAMQGFLVERSNYGVQRCCSIDMMDTQGACSSLSTSDLQTSDVGGEHLEKAAKRADKILTLVQPTEASERRRKEIIEYIQMITKATYGIEVFPFGSGPLKTYLPEGDIDLTAMCSYGDEFLVEIFSNLLQSQTTTNMGFQVRDVKCIPAQVKVVRCLVDNISVDITFNQIAALSKLKFLEQVDEVIGEDHLFRRSVILAKAWCYYESRILGANHGLISTYALETMVLHIINLFRSSLHSPLIVLYKFLQYYSTFNWDIHCVAFNGLVLLSSLPELKMQPAVDSEELVITDELLNSFRNLSQPTGKNIKKKEMLFRIKYLNIMDPLRENNNLGVSVSQGSFYRIKSAFSYGFETLQSILWSPSKNLNTGVDELFKTLLMMNAQSWTKIDVCSVRMTDLPSLDKADEVDASLENNATLLIPSKPKSGEEDQINQSSPQNQEEEDDQQIETSPQNNEEEEIVVVKPISLADMNEFPTIESHNRSSRVRKVNIVADGGKGKGAWSKPLLWKAAEKDKKDSKGRDLGAWKVPLKLQPHKDCGGSKDGTKNKASPRK